MSQIPPEIQLAAQAIIKDFNRKILSRATQYVPRFKGCTWIGLIMVSDLMKFAGLNLPVR